jgi:hypothetical protein
MKVLAELIACDAARFRNGCLNGDSNFLNFNQFFALFSSPPYEGGVAAASAVGVVLSFQPKHSGSSETTSSLFR